MATSKPNDNLRKTSSKMVTEAGRAKRSSARGKPDELPIRQVVKISAPTVAGPDLKKKELIDLVTTRSGIKKKDAKPVIEAMLAILGESLGSGRELNLAPLGKLRINRTEEKANGRVIVCKLRQASGAAKTAKDPLAEPSE